MPRRGSDRPALYDIHDDDSDRPARERAVARSQLRRPRASAVDVRARVYTLPALDVYPVRPVLRGTAIEAASTAGAGRGGAAYALDRMTPPALGMSRWTRLAG